MSIIYNFVTFLCTPSIAGGIPPWVKSTPGRALEEIFYCIGQGFSIGIWIGVSILGLDAALEGRCGEQ